MDISPLSTKTNLLSLAIKEGLKPFTSKSPFPTEIFILFVTSTVAENALIDISPNKGVITGSRTGMDGPRRRNDGLVIIHPNVSCFLRFSHKVTNGLVFWNV